MDIADADRAWSCNLVFYQIFDVLLVYYSVKIEMQVIKSGAKINQNSTAQRKYEAGRWRIW